MIKLNKSAKKFFFKNEDQNENKTYKKLQLKD